MDKATSRMMNDSERSMLRLIESKRFAKLDTEELIELHTRVRRARNKYATNYRRQGAKRVGQDRSRGMASSSNKRTAAKAEAFEDALATVSARLAKLTAANAKAIKAERLAAARAVKKASAKKSADKRKQAAARKASVKKAAAKKQAKTPASLRQNASKRASNKRKQAKRDKR